MRTPAARAPGGGGAVPGIPWPSPPATVLPGCTPSSPALTHSGPGMASPQPLCPRRFGEVAQPARKTSVGGRVAPDVTGVDDEPCLPLRRPPRPCPALRGRLPGAQNRDVQGPPLSFSGGPAPTPPPWGAPWLQKRWGTWPRSPGESRGLRRPRRRRSRRRWGPSAGGGGEDGTSKGWVGAVPGSALRAGNRVAPIHCLIDSRAFGRLRGGCDSALLVVGFGVGGSFQSRPLPRRLGESFIPAAPDAPRTRLWSV